MSANAEPTIVEVSHTLGSWLVSVYPALTEEQYLALCAGKTQATSSWIDFKTSGLAIGWIKRLAKNSPDRGSSFVVVPWNGKFSIYFGG